MKPSLLEPEGARRVQQFFNREAAAASGRRALRERRLNRLISAMLWLSAAMLVALNVAAWTGDAWAAFAACVCGAVTAVLFLIAVPLAWRLDHGSQS